MTQLLQELQQANSVDICPDDWGAIDSKEEQIETTNYTIVFNVSGFVANYSEVSPYHSQDPRFEDNTSVDTQVTNVSIYDDYGDYTLSGEEIEEIANYINNNLLNIEL
ncbi:MAG TPA: hypothetical protein VFQ86_05945 [Arachidicoccus soli]|nr:hypothetical protein [Arachidicoccus soli]